MAEPICPILETISLPGAAEIIVWAESARGNCWYATAALIAAQRQPEQNRPTIHLTRGNAIDSIAYSDLSAQFVMGEGPDLVQTTIERLILWQEAGYLTSLDDCIQRHAEFKAIKSDAWPVATIDNQIWAIPFDTTVTMLFYNKAMLRQLGWSEEQIASLPHRVGQGDFLLQDLLDTAQTAIAAGVTEPGFGYWPHYSRPWDLVEEYGAFGGSFLEEGSSALFLNPAVLQELFAFHKQLNTAGVMPVTVVGNAANNWSSRLVRRDAIASGRVLFWQSESSEVARLWHDFPEAFKRFQEDFGAGPFPSAVVGKPGSINLNYTFFVIPSEQATRHVRQAAACDLLARMIDRDISAHHSVTSFRVGMVTGLMNESVFAQHPIMPKMESLLDYGHTSPALREFPHFRDVLTSYMLRVERGEIEPDAAVAMAVTELESLFGDQLVVTR